jgi:hypothetical protein
MIIYHMYLAGVKVGFRRLAWGTKVVVLADAAFPSKETRTPIKKRGSFVVMSLPRTWRCSGDRALSDRVKHLPHGTSRDVVALSTRRWTVALFIKEVKGVVGLGQAQVTKDPQRVERSVALSFMAYVLLITSRAKNTPHTVPGVPLPSHAT